MSTHLAIDISARGAVFYSLRNNNVIDQLELHFESSKQEVVKEELNRAFSDEYLLKVDYDEISLAWSTNQSTLVPNNVFADSNPESIFRLCYGKAVPSEEIDYNRISELSVVNVFQIPVWLKTFFVIKFPRVVVQHAGTHQLRKSMDANAFRAKATVTVYDTYCQVSIVKHNQLEFYSFFDVQSAEDVIYHLMFTLQQKELTDEKGSIELAVGAGLKSGILEDVQKGLEKVKDLKQYSISSVSDFTPKAQLLCV